MKRFGRCRAGVTLAALLFVLASGRLGAQEAYRTPDYLKRLTIEELTSFEITSVSRKPEPLWQAASAIDVITADEIRRSGVTNIPDALRLATGVHVAQIDGHTWAISTRGFNISTANKMQVLMDGRNLYTPLFSGVFWDVQHTFMPDIQQIEVIRGPGATLWGANAVNGVINITTRTAKETQGGLVYGGGGYHEGFFGGVRYGGKIAKDIYYRAYFTQLNRDSLKLEGNGDAEDDTALSQGGFRIDADLSADDLLTLQGDVYAGAFGQLNGDDVDVDGANVLARWTHQMGEDSSFLVQTYYDRTHRLIQGLFEEHRNTWDIELQHRFPLTKGHDFIYGLNYRISSDEIGNLGPQLAFLPDEETVHLISGYLQDEISLVPDVFSIIVGSKFEYNSFSGFEVQPSGRFIWTPNTRNTVWGAVSRAVRTPTRFDQDLFIPNPEFGAPVFVRGTRDFDAEELIAYELGYRTQVLERVSLEANAFYHDYSNLRSVEPGPGGGLPQFIENQLQGESYGGAVRSVWRITDWWEIEGNVALLQTDVDREPGSQDTSGGTGEANDPTAIALLRSSMDLPRGFEFDTFLRYVEDLPVRDTPEYLTLDARLGWWISEDLEVAIVGRNLLDDGHPEFRQGAINREVRRSVYGTIRWRF